MSGIFIFAAGACAALCAVELGAREYRQAAGSAIMMAALLAAAAVL